MSVLVGYLVGFSIGVVVTHLAWKRHVRVIPTPVEVVKEPFVRVGTGRPGHAWDCQSNLREGYCGCIYTKAFKETDALGMRTR